jgi:hypothetical protein
VRECRRWLDWSATQIEACLAADGAANGELLAAFERLMRHERGDDVREMTAVVVSVQAHDRIMQQLIHVVESLRALHRHLGDPRRAGSAEHWVTLRDNQWRRFSMSEERALFGRMFADPDAPVEPPAAAAGGGAELFDT